jgi:hypothetical protein
VRLSDLPPLLFDDYVMLVGSLLLMQVEPPM